MIDTEYGFDPQGRLRMPGIYSATVIDNQDPLKRGALKLQIHQTTSTQITNWVPGCFPVTDTSYHPDHNPHLASDIANMLTTQSTTATDPQGGSVTVPALTVVAKNASYQLNHAHVSSIKNMLKTSAQNIKTITTTTQTATDLLESSAYANGTTAPNQAGTVSSNITNSTTPEHTFHRTIPAIGQLIWFMFIGGDPDKPVWMGVQG
jgi:hypothetical protein